MKKRASEVEPVVRNSPATTTTSGRVKIYSPTGKKQYRLTWYEDGKQNGTTAKSFTHAVEKASVIEKRLLAKHGDRSLLSVKEMIEAYLNPDEDDLSRGEWGDNHRVNVENSFAKWVLPALGTMTCADLTSADFSDLVGKQTTTSNADHLASYLSKFINWAYAEEWILVEPESMSKGLRAQVKKVTKRVGDSKPTVAGENALKVDKSEIPDEAAVFALGQAAKNISGDWWQELLVNLAAYSGLRIGESFDLDIDSINLARREITISTQKIEVRGEKKRTLPKWDTIRTTTYPLVTPGGYALHKNLTKRVRELKKLQASKQIPSLQDGSKRLLLFPNKSGGWQSASYFGKSVRRPAQEVAGWPKDENGKFLWTHHSLRHVFCSYYIFDRKGDVRDVSIAAGHKSYTTTMDMYRGQSQGALDRLKKL